MTRSRAAYRRGDAILARFVSSGETGAKRRPAIGLRSEECNRGHGEVFAVAITSNVHRLLLGDHQIRDWQQAGLLYRSVVTRILRTVKQGMIERRLGQLGGSDMEAVRDQVRTVLGL